MFIPKAFVRASSELCDDLYALMCSNLQKIDVGSTTYEDKDVCNFVDPGDLITKALYMAVPLIGITIAKVWYDIEA